MARVQIDAPIRDGGVGAGMSTSGDLLIGVDIGGTFTDVVVRRPGAADPDHEDPEHAQGPQPRGAAGARAHGDRLGLGATAGRPFRARHHGCDQRGAGAQGCPCRLDHHRRFPRRARDRPPDAPPDVRSGARSGDADVSGARPLPPRGPRARRGDWRSAASARRGRRRRRGRRAGRGRRPCDRGRVPVLVPQQRARAPRPRDHRRAPPRRVRLHLLRGRSGLPRVRAHGRHDLRRLREAGRRPLPRQSRRRARRCTRSGSFADHAVPRRHLGLGNGAAAPGAALSLGAGRRRDRRAHGR